MHNNAILAAGALPPSNAPWLVEIGGWVAFIVVAALLIYRWVIARILFFPDNPWVP